MLGIFDLIIVFKVFIDFLSHFLVRFEMQITWQHYRHRRSWLGCVVIFLVSFMLSSTYYLTTWEDLKVIKRKQMSPIISSSYRTPLNSRTPSPKPKTLSLPKLPLNPKQKEAINEERIISSYHQPTWPSLASLQLPLNPNQEEAISEERQKILEEMEGYNFTELGLPSGITLDDLVMEKGGEPIKMMLLATWRTGSSFIGSLISSHPGTYFEYEPLMFFNDNQLRLVYPGKKEKDALQVLNGLLSCNYFAYNPIEFHKLQGKFYDARKAFMFMGKMNRRYETPEVLSDPNFYSAMCRLFPFQLIKTVRLRLGIGKKLLENKKHENLRILLLVRDPRAIMMSRWLAGWCGPPDCTDLVRLCVQMEQDFEEAKLLRKEYPDRFLALRYEDISLNPEVASRKILKFFRLQFHPKVQQFLMDNTKRNGRSLISRDSSRHTFSWMENFHGGNFTRLLLMQKYCSKAMEYWGYPKISDRRQLNPSFVPLLNPQWPEMNIGL